MLTLFLIVMDTASSSSPRTSASLSRTRSRRWRQSRTGTAVLVVAALLLSTTAWLSLVFSGTTARCWHRLAHWEEATPHALPWNTRHPTTTLSAVRDSPPPPQVAGVGRNRSLSEHGKKRHHYRIQAPAGAGEELTLQHIVFGIAGSSQLWQRRKEFVRLWWRPDEMRGHVWLEEQVGKEDWDDSLPTIMISEDTSRFRYTNPTGHPSGLRIARIISETFRLGLSHVRWFVLGDDDTVFSADNLVAVLSKYDSSELVYIGGPSESHSANSYFSHFMAYGGGGIALSYPLAEALSTLLDDCLERYHDLYGSDDRLHACISELGVPLTRELGFHQWDIRGNAHGLLSAHPVAPFVSIHHVEAVDPFYPGLSSLDSLTLFTKAMVVDPMSFLQRSICYDHANHLSFSVSLGYVIQVFPNIVLPRVLERSENTYSAWNGIRHRNEFDLDNRDPPKSVCKRPILFFLKDIARQGNESLGSYKRARTKDHLKRKVFCFPHSPPLPYMKNINVVVHPMRTNWHLVRSILMLLSIATGCWCLYNFAAISKTFLLQSNDFSLYDFNEQVPRRLCCKLNQTTDEILTISVGQCDKGPKGSFIGSM